MELSTIDTVARYCAVKAGLLCVCMRQGLNIGRHQQQTTFLFFSSSTPPIPRLFVGGEGDERDSAYTFLFRQAGPGCYRAELGYIDASSSSFEPPSFIFPGCIRLLRHESRYVCCRMVSNEANGRCRR